MAERRARRRGAVWVVVGGGVLVAAIIVTAVVVLMDRPSSPEVALTTPVSESPASTNGPSVPGEAAVDPTVIERGWVPEPITTDAEEYLRAALEAAGSMDTTRSDRDAWVTYLETWFTPDPRLTDPADQATQMQRYMLTMRDVVVFPDQVWESIAAQSGRVTAEVTDEVQVTPVPDYDGDDMVIGTADLTLTYTQFDGDGAEQSYEEQVRISAQVLCGPASVPTPGTAQAAGDCKLIRYFDEPLSD